MTDYHNEDFGQLIGKTLTDVTISGRDSISFTADTGERWSMYYEPDCCASAQIEDIVGDPRDLIDSPIVIAEVAYSQENPLSEHEESFTWTFYKLATAKGYVTIRWYGSSNGYYSEEASFKRVTP